MSGIRLGINIDSLRAQRRLQQGSAELSKTFERLSSGQRINRAVDDAAGLSISEKLRADRGVFNQAVRNINDGVSLLNIADSAISNLTSIVTRITELAAQSANGVLGSKQRRSLDKEAQALSKEYTRIALSTEFNGVSLFNGSLDGLRLQAGFGIDGSIFSSLGGAIGNGTFSSSLSVDGGAGPQDVTSGDFNGDGLLDLVAANYVAGSLTVSLGNGDGTFKAATTITSASAGAVTSSDLNGDGVLDLISGSPNSGTVRIHIGIGDGSFKSGVTFIANLNGVVGLYSQDFNGDGNMDIATANSAGSSIGIYYGNGTGAFAAGTALSTGSNTTSVIGADLNGDGVIDLINSDRTSNSVSIHIGNGDGTFRARVSYGGVNGAESVNVGDFNGDGKLDVVSANATGNSIGIFLGNGDGTFTTVVTYTSSNAPSAVGVGDFNGDGIPDVMSADNTGNQLSIFMGRGDGTFDARRSVALGVTNPSALALSDFNNDGVVDVAVNYGVSSRVGIYIGGRVDGVGPLLPFDLTTKHGSGQALSLLSNKLNQLNLQRGAIGSFLSRVNVSSGVLEATVENYAQAESRIRDADIGEESANLARLNILQQATTAVLAQANIQPELAIELLKS